MVDILRSKRYKYFMTVTSSSEVVTYERLGDRSVLLCRSIVAYIL